MASGFLQRAFIRSLSLQRHQVFLFTIARRFCHFIPNCNMVVYQHPLSHRTSSVLTPALSDRKWTFSELFSVEAIFSEQSKWYLTKNLKNMKKFLLWAYHLIIFNKLILMGIYKTFKFCWVTFVLKNKIQLERDTDHKCTILWIFIKLIQCYKDMLDKKVKHLKKSRNPLLPLSGYYLPPRR